MSSQDQLNLLYDIRTLGASKVISELDQINKLFAEIKKNKQLLSALKSGIGVESTDELKAMNTQLGELVKKEAELSIALKEKQVQLKEAQLLRQAELAQQRAITSGATAVAGSYNDIAKRYRELNQLTKNNVALGTPEMDIARQKLKALKDQLDEYNRALSKDGLLVAEYTTGIVQAFNKLGLGDVIKSQLNSAKGALQGLNTEFDKLGNEFREARAAGVTSLEAIERELIENRQRAAELQGQINNMETAFNQAGTIGQQISQNLSNSFKRLKQDIGAFIVGYVGFQQAVSGIRNAISLNKQLSDQMTDLGRILQVSQAAVRGIAEEIRNIPTRTGLTELFDFALIAAKTGTAEQDIAGVVRAIDELSLVAGKELGANIDQTVTAVAKLINIFEGPGKVSEQNILRYGNALIELANKGVATGEFLVDFAQRLSGIEGMTKIQIQAVLGLAAAFEEQGLSAEVAATASSQLLTKISSDIPKYAALAKQTTEAFRELVRTNPGEALLAVAEGVKGNAEFFDEFAGTLKDVGAEGARVAAAFGVMGDKADFFREKIAIADAAIGQTGAISEAAAAKQQNLAATFDNVAKAMEKAASSRGFRLTLQAIGSILIFLIGNIPTLITVTLLLTAAWAAQNTVLIANRIAILALNVQILAYRILLGATTILTVAHSAAIALLTGAYGAGTTAVLAFGRALSITPLGAVLTIVGLLAGAVTVLATTMTSGASAAKALGQEHAILAEVTKRAGDATADQLSKLRLYVSVLNSATASASAKKRALQDLIALSPDYLGTLTQENIKTAEGINLLNGYVKLLRQKAEMEAAQSLLTDKTRRELELTEQEYQLQLKINKGLTDYNDLTEEQQKFVTERAYRTTPFAQSLLDLAGGGSAAQNAIDEIRRQREAVVAEIGATQKVIEDRLNATVSATPANAPVGPVGRTINAIESEIESVTKLRKAVEIGSPAFDGYTTKLKNLNTELQKLNGTYKETVSKLGTGEREAFKRIDAAMNDKLTALKTAFNSQNADQKVYNGALIDNEAEFRKQELAITTDALNKKIATLRDKNNEEKRLKAQLNLELVDANKRYNDFIYQQQVDALEAQRQQRENAAKELLADVDGNPNASPLEKAAAEANYYSRILELQTQFNEGMSELEKQYSKTSATNEADRNKAIVNLRRQLGLALLDVTTEGIGQEMTEIENRFTDEMIRINSVIRQKMMEILSDPTLGREGRERAVQQLQNDYAQEIFDAEIARIKAREEEYTRMLNNNLLTTQQYNVAMDKLDGERFDAWKKKNDEQMRADALKRQQDQQAIQSLTNIYTTFSQGYVNNLNKEADATYEKTLAIAEAEKQAKLEKAVSEQEKLDIEAEFQGRRDEAEKNRLRERKRIAQIQLALEFALASMKAINAGFDAGGIPGAIAAEAWVVLEYAAKYAVMQNAQFEKGGLLYANGGILGGKRHGLGGTPFMFGGRQYEAEQGEVMMIMNRDAAMSNTNFSVTGTPAQITSALNAGVGGGKNFAPGGVMSRYEYGGALGASLSAPSFVSSSGGTMGGMQDLKMMMQTQYSSLDALSKTVMRMQVHINVRDVDSAINANNAADKLADI